MSKKSMNPEQSLGHVIAVMAVMKSFLGVLAGCNVRDVRHTKGVIPTTRVDVFGSVQGWDGRKRGLKISVFVPDDRDRESSSLEERQVIIHGHSTWNWDVRGRDIVLVNGFNLGTGNEIPS